MALFLFFSFFLFFVFSLDYPVLLILKSIVKHKFIFQFTLKCLSIGTPKAINFPFVSNEKLNFLGVPVFKHIIMRL